MAFKHEGFWRPMDTLKDKEVLEDLVEQGRMPWRSMWRRRPLSVKCQQEGRIGRLATVPAVRQSRRPRASASVRKLSPQRGAGLR